MDATSGGPPSSGCGPLFYVRAPIERLAMFRQSSGGLRAHDDSESSLCGSGVLAVQSMDRISSTLRRGERANAARSKPGRVAGNTRAQDKRARMRRDRNSVAQQAPR